MCIRRFQVTKRLMDIVDGGGVEYERGGIG